MARSDGDPLDPLRREVDDELEFHLRGVEDELVGRGWPRDEARREARRRFGDVDRIRDDCRDLRRDSDRREGRGHRMDAVRQDLRLALREVIRDRGLAALVVTTLALGIGFATALFSIVDGVLLRPLPYPDAERLVYLWQNDRATGTAREPAGTADFYDFRDRTRSFESVSMFGTFSASMLRDGAEPLHLSLVASHHDLAAVLGVEPALGRWLTAEETEGGGAMVLVLSHALWQTAFDADRGVLGRVVTLDGSPVEIVGVMPPDADVVMGGSVDAYTPLRSTRAEATRSPHFATVVARLAPGVGLEAARSEMTALAARLEEEVPANANRGAFVEPLDDFLRGDVKGTVWALLGAVGVLLLLSALNVTNLFLARATSRARESAVHAALGAGWVRTARRNLAVTCLLALVAGVTGVGVARVALAAVSTMAPPELLLMGTPGLDLGVLGFSLALALALGVAFGLTPTVSALRVDLQPTLSGARGDGEGGRGGGAARRLLVAGQAALAAVLLVGAGLVGTTLVNLHRVDKGFSTDGLLRMTMTLPATRYPADFATYPDWPERLRFQREVIDAVQAIPGVELAALTVNHSLDPGFTNSFSVEGRAADPDQGEMTTRMVTPGYFQAVGLELLRGRLPTQGEGADDPGVVVINRTAAERHFPGGDALGSRIGFWGTGFREIVGIVADEKVLGLRADAPPAFYTSLHQTPVARGPVTLLVRSRGEPLSLASAVREAVWSIDPQLALYDVTTMDATLARATRRERFASTVLSVFAGMALVLAALGVYGVLSYAVARRTRELGIRQALGADRGRLRTMVVRQGLGLVLLGAAGGLGVAWLGAGALEGLLFGIGRGDPRVYAGTAAVLSLVAMAAAAVPAFRASSVEPARSLRSA